MEIKGKIIRKLDLMQGTSKAGNPWKKQEYVLETQDAYPKQVHFDFFGDKADQFPLNIGDFVNLSFDIESREYNGRWFTSIRGWKAEKVAENAPAQSAPQSVPQGAPVNQGGPSVPPPEFSGPDENDDLPF